MTSLLVPPISATAKTRIGLLFTKDGRKEEAYLEYFGSILDNLKVYSNFDIYGHLDYVVRYGG